MSGSATRHHYKHTLNCTKGVRGQVSAAYDVPSGRATERLSGLKGEATVEWSCPLDPWIRPAVQGTCVRQLAQATENGAPVGSAKVGTTRYPYSAIVLSDAQRHVLDAQLQTALKTKATGPATPAPTPVPVLGRAKALATPAEFKASVPPSNDHIRLTWQDTTSESHDKMRISERVGGGLLADQTLLKDQTLLTDYSYGIKERDGAIYALTACNSAGCSAPTTVTFARR